jgi:hypothetical protein
LQCELDVALRATTERETKSWHTLLRTGKPLRSALQKQYTPESVRIIEGKA